MKQRILIADAEPVFRGNMEQALRQEGFHVLTAANCRDALLLASKEELDLMIVNLHLSDAEGRDICKLIRETPRARTIPVLAMSSKNTEGLAARGLNSGADGFLHHHADGPELIAHVRALLRRPRNYLWENDVLQKGRITLRMGERGVQFDHKELPSLTPKEYALFLELIIRAPRVVERGGLVTKVWGIPLEQLGRKTLDVHIQRIRRKLGSAATHLKTISLIGYQWLESTTP